LVADLRDMKLSMAIYAISIVIGYTSAEIWSGKHANTVNDNAHE
jgi:hypothetical protein